MRSVTSNTAGRQAAFLKRQREAGIVSVTVLVPLAAADDVRCAAAVMRNNPKIGLGCLVNRDNGRLVSLRKAK